MTIVKRNFLPPNDADTLDIINMVLPFINAAYRPVHLCFEGTFPGERYWT
jgi:hypothetical protein